MCIDFIIVFVLVFELHENTALVNYLNIAVVGLRQLNAP